MTALHYSLKFYKAPIFTRYSAPKLTPTHRAYSRGSTPFLFAIKTFNSLSILQTLIDHKANVMQSDYVGDTTLHYAVGYGTIKCRNLPYDPHRILEVVMLIAL